MAFHLDTWCYSIPDPASPPEGTFGVIMEMLLKTRLKLHLETNGQGYDEDVNAYLAGVLVSYIDPQYLRSISEFLSEYDVDLYQAVSKAQGHYQVYRIYKVNADDRLLSLAMFQAACPQEQGGGQLDRIKEYYHCASEYQRRMYGKSTAVSEIQTKLAEGTQRYLAILSAARVDYFHLAQRLDSQELAMFCRHLKQMEQELPLKSKLDELLDAYSRWIKGDRDLLLREKISTLLQEVHRLDPAFETKPFSL